MAKGGKLRPEQIRLAQRLLQDLPEKDERKTREEAAGLLEKDFRKAFKKGYAPKELSAMLKNAGIIIPAYLVEKFLKPENGESGPRSASKPAPAKAEETAPAGACVVPDATAREET